MLRFRCWSGPQGESTEGRLGNVYFSYTRNAGCELGCSTDSPLVPQAQEVLVAHLSEKQGRVKVSSSKPSILKIVRVETQRGKKLIEKLFPLLVSNRSEKHSKRLSLLQREALWLCRRV